VGRFAAWIATGAILLAGALSFLAFGIWVTHHFPKPLHDEHAAAHEDSGVGGRESGAVHGAHGSASYDGNQRSSYSRDKMPLTMVALLQESGATKASEHAAQPPTTATVKEPDAEHGEKIEVEHPVYSGEYYTLGVFGPLRVTISYYIDALTVL